MLFQIKPTTPRFQVFTALNQELLTFIERAQETGDFRRSLFTVGNVGQTCWNNSKVSNAKATNDLTKEKFEKFFIEIQKLNAARRTQLFECLRDNQNLSVFFTNPQPNLLNGFPTPLNETFKTLAKHLYAFTKDLQPIIDHCGGNNISAHFLTYRKDNGNVCKACGMSVLSPLRHNVKNENQWRADYDHQLCKSKYPLYSVHPDNLIPLCDVCNQDAKKSKDVFKDKDGNSRSSFYPYEESCKDYIGFKVESLRDPEISIDVEWLTNDEKIIEKLNTWDDVYDIRDIALGKYFDLVAQIVDDINPTSFAHMKSQITEKSRLPLQSTYSRKPWAFWEYKFYSKLCLLTNDDLEAIWGEVVFSFINGDEFYKRR
jgi:hypothetical protein